MSANERVKFGNWLSTSPATIAGLTLVGWLCVVCSIMLMVTAFVFGRFAAGFLSLFLGLIFVVVFMWRIGEMDAGRTIADRLFEKVRQLKRNAVSESQYRSGIFSTLPVDQLNALPGALAVMEEIDGVDGTGEPFTVLHHTGTKQLALTLTCVPDGTDLLPQSLIDAQVAAFGGWHASQARDTALAGATVSVDSSYSSKEPLIAKLEGEVAPWAPEVARRAHAQAAALLPNHYTQTSVHTTLIWDKKALGENLDDCVAEIAAKIPHHRDSLYAAGAGLPTAATSEDLAKIVQAAYNPQRKVEQGTDELLEHENPMRLVDAGPDYFDDFQRRVAFHDGVCSMTVMMTVPPRIHITESTFKILFEPSEKFLSKRSMLFYRSPSIGEGIKKTQQLRKQTRVSATAKGMASGFDAQKVRLAEKAENDMVQGASMVVFSIMVTVTFENSAQAYRDATQRLKSLLEATNMTYRFVETGVSAAFHSTLPLGILPWAYQTRFDKVVEGL